MSKLEVISFNKQIFHAVSLSGGKDSTAMLLLMIERGLPINTVLWADTDMEFPEMYDHGKTCFPSSTTKCRCR